VCWNQDGWSHPSGAAPLAEGAAKGSKATFASENRYGHEEWLFRPEHTIDGWRYGFLQPSLKASKSLYGKELDVVLYTIDPDDRRWYLGRIDGLVVLDEADAEPAVVEFENRGWLDSMRGDLSALGLSPANLWSPVPARERVNVKYKPAQAHMLPEAREAPDGDVTMKRGKNRYRFYRLNEIPKAIAGTHADPDQPVDAYSYRTAPIVHADRRHNRLQLRLAKMLRAKYGHDAVRLEVDGVDIILTRTGGILFVEVKSEPDARLAIRAALGQLLEYALFARPDSAVVPELVVAAPGQSDAAVDVYVKRLSRQFQLPIRYVAFNEDTPECPL
jgi:hypothetical protein